MQAQPQFPATASVDAASVAIRRFVGTDRVRLHVMADSCLMAALPPILRQMNYVEDVRGAWPTGDDRPDVFLIDGRLPGALDLGRSLPPAQRQARDEVQACHGSHGNAG